MKPKPKLKPCPFCGGKQTEGGRKKMKVLIDGRMYTGTKFKIGPGKEILQVEGIQGHQVDLPGALPRRALPPDDQPPAEAYETKPRPVLPWRRTLLVLVPEGGPAELEKCRQLADTLQGLPPGLRVVVDAGAEPDAAPKGWPERAWYWYRLGAALILRVVPDPEPKAAIADQTR